MNKTFSAILVASFVLASSVWSLAAESSEQTAVREAFAAYKSAALKDDGDTAVKQLSRGTIDWYGDMLKLALYGDADKVRSQSPFCQIMILRMRSQIPRDKLQEMAGKDVAVYAINNGWLNKDTVEKLDVGEISIDGGSATAPMMSGNAKAGVEHRFVNEAGSWRLDLLHNSKIVDAALSAMAGQQGMTQEQLVLVVLASTTGKTPDATIWNPLFPTLEKPADATEQGK